MDNGSKDSKVMGQIFALEESISLAQTKLEILAESLSPIFRVGVNSDKLQGPIGSPQRAETPQTDSEVLIRLINAIRQLSFLSLRIQELTEHSDV